jgi:hypothetical protein
MMKEKRDIFQSGPLGHRARATRIGGSGGKIESQSMGRGWIAVTIGGALLSLLLVSGLYLHAQGWHIHVGWDGIYLRNGCIILPLLPPSR